MALPFELAADDHVAKSAELASIAENDLTKRSAVSAIFTHADNGTVAVELSAPLIAAEAAIEQAVTRTAEAIFTPETLG